ncbi:MAG: 30S ribosome-binding factor RbfA [Chloroflexi bacterium]|nr:30S ribosome-binding factor RbfA [Chloroflexota bacterium]
MSRRMERVNATLKRELGLLIHEALADPRIAPLTSVTDVDTSPDLTTAKVSVSVMGTDEERSATLTALESAAGFLRHSVEDKVRMRHVPRLSFKLDTRLGKTAEMMAFMDEIAREDVMRRRAE